MPAQLKKSVLELTTEQVSTLARFNALAPTIQDQLLQDFEQRTPGVLTSPLSAKTKRQNFRFYAAYVQQFYIYLAIKLELARELLKEIREHRHYHNSHFHFSFGYLNDDTDQELEQVLQNPQTSMLTKLEMTMARLDKVVPLAKEYVKHWETRRQALQQEQKQMEETHVNAQVAMLTDTLNLKPGQVDRTTLVQVAKTLSTIVDSRLNGPDIRVLQKLNIAPIAPKPRFEVGTAILLVGKLREKFSMPLKQSISMAEQFKTLREDQLGQIADMLDRINLVQEALTTAQQYEQRLRSQITEVKELLHAFSTPTPDIQQYFERFVNDSSRMIDEMEHKQEEVMAPKYTSPTPFSMTPKPPGTVK